MMNPHSQSTFGSVSRQKAQFLDLKETQAGVYEMKMNDERFCKHFIWDHTLVNVYSSWPGWFCLIKEITWDKKVLRTIVRFFTVHNKPRDEGGFLVSIKLNIFSLWPIIYLTAGHLFWQEKMYLFNIKRPMNFNFPLLPYYIT